MRRALLALSLAVLFLFCAFSARADLPLATNAVLAFFETSYDTSQLRFHGDYEKAALYFYYWTNNIQCYNDSRSGGPINEANTNPLERRGLAEWANGSQYGIANTSLGGFHLLEIDANGFIKATAQGSSPGPSSVTDSAKNFADGSWHHCVSILDHTTLTVTLWIDGASIGTGSATDGTLNFGGVFCAGEFADAGTFTFTGFINEPSAYPFAPSSGQIVSLFGQTHP